MSNIRRIYLPVLLLAGVAMLGLSSFAVTAQAAEAQADKIAIVNVQRILKEASANKDINEQMKNKQASYQKSFDKKDQELREEDKKIAKSRSVISQEAYQDQVGKFKEKVTKIQQDAQKKRTELDKAYSNALSKVNDEMLKVISKLSEEQGFTVAIPASQVLFVSTGKDITNEVISQLDKKLPKVKVVFSSEG